MKKYDVATLNPSTGKIEHRTIQADDFLYKGTSENGGFVIIFVKGDERISLVSNVVNIESK